MICKWTNKFIACTIMFLSLAIFSFGENTILRLDEFIQNIELFHPLVKQANLKLKIGEAQILKAKGNFDPTIRSEWSEKNLDDKLYYRQFHTKLRIPTHIGVDIVSGYENNQGVYLNHESTVKQNGLWHIGLEVDVLQGLITNERKTALKIASEYNTLLRNEKVQYTNDVLINAISAYLQWQMYSQIDSILNENIELSTTYHNNTLHAFSAGEKTAIDTLEAHMLLQEAQYTSQKNLIDLTKSKYNVENFLWYENQAISLQTNTKPETFSHTTLFKIVETKISDTSIENNPYIQTTLNKLSIAEIEQRLKIEKLKPKLKIKYNPLFNYQRNDILPNYYYDNSAFGAVFTMPLFLRNERAEIQQNKIKIQELKLDIDNKKNELNNKISNAKIQLSLIQTQIKLLYSNITNLEKLLEAENEKFNFGESSVFLLNKRQEKLITTKIKLIECLFKQESESLNYLYYTNQLGTK